MKVSSLGLDLIKAYESLRLKAYLCPAGKWTIGWGHTAGVRPGDTCTREEAENMLAQDAAFAERRVLGNVKAPLTQNQFDALVSFAFNVRGFEASTLVKKINAGDYGGAAKEFPRWNKGQDPKTGKFVVLNGLVARRDDEMKLFESKAA